MTLTKDMVVARETARRAALVAVDKTALADILSEDLIWTHATGGTDTKDSYIAALGAKARFLSVEPDKEMVRVFDDAAAIKSEMTMVIQPNEQDPITLRTFALGIWAIESDGVLRMTHFQSGTIA